MRRRLYLCHKLKCVVALAPPTIASSYVLSRRKGQAYLELALSVPILIVLMLGLVGVGLAIDCKLKVEGVAREAARAASKSTSDQAEAVALHQAQNVADEYKLTPASLSITLTGLGAGGGGESDTAPDRGQVITATVRYQFRLFGFFDIDVNAKHSEVVDCWRSRSDDSSGGSCAS